MSLIKKRKPKLISMLEDHSFKCSYAPIGIKRAREVPVLVLYHHGGALRALHPHLSAAPLITPESSGLAPEALRMSADRNRVVPFFQSLARSEMAFQGNQKEKVAIFVFPPFLGQTQFLAWCVCVCCKRGSPSGDGPGTLMEVARPGGWWCLKPRAVHQGVPQDLKRTKSLSNLGLSRPDEWVKNPSVPVGTRKMVSLTKPHRDGTDLFLVELVELPAFVFNR